MSPAPTVTVDVHLPPGHRRAALLADARAGLLSPAKSLPPTWFYDERGSRLFDEITRLPEYHLTRAERSILTAHAGEIVRAAGCDVLVELGSGTSEKTRLLLDAMQRAGSLARYVPFDVSEEVLRESAAAVAVEHAVEVHAVVGDFHRHLGTLPRGGRRLVAFLGSTIGNLDSAQRRRFLTDLDAALDHGDRLLLGTDLVVEPSRLVAAYDDAAGVTAAFNKNVLAVLNAELGAAFDLDAFEHVARWSPEYERVEMHLRATNAQQVPVADLGAVVQLAAGETIHTEISCKFRPEPLREELWEAGFVVERTWQDPAGDFQLALARPYC